MSLLGGIKFADVLNFVDHIDGGRSELKQLSCFEVLNRFIIPATEDIQMSYTSKIYDGRIIPTENFPTEAAFIVAHAMEDCFLDIIDALQLYLNAVDTAKESPDLWIDLFCINYHTTRPEHWVEQVQSASRKIGNTVLILSPWDSLKFVKNPLCLYQIYFTGVKGMLLDIAMTGKQLERFSRVADVSKETIDRILTSNIRIPDLMHSFGKFAPLNAETMLLSDLLDTREHQQSFCDVIGSKIRDWLQAFHEHRTFLTVPTSHAADLYTFKVSEWLDKHLLYFEAKSQTSISGISTSSREEAGTDSSSRQDRVSSYATYLAGDEAQQLGLSHPNNLKAMESLVKLYYDEGDFVASMRCLRTLYSVYDLHRGPYQPETLHTMLRIVLLQRKITKQILSDTSISIDEDHATVIHQSQEAETLLSTVIERLQYLYDSNHPNILVLRKLQADILYEAPFNNHGESLSQFQSLYDIIQPVVGYKHPVTMEIINRIGFLMIYHFYRVIDGLTFASKALENVLALYGQQDPIVALYEANYHAMLDAVHRYDRDHHVNTAIPSHLMMYYEIPANSTLHASPSSSSQVSSSAVVMDPISPPTVTSSVFTSVVGSE